MDYVKKFLWTGNEEDELHGGVIRWDLEWIVNNWQAKGFDLWEEIESTDFFWNRMAFKFVLDQGQVFAKKMGDEELVETYKICAQTIHITLNNHWNGEFMHQCEQRPKDSAVIHAFVSFPGVYNALDQKIAGTIHTLNKLFFNEYDVNKNDYLENVPGILWGRYEADHYGGGNPW